MDMDDDTEDGTALLSIKLLRLFDLLYSTNSVTRTGEAMGQSQPTVSNWLSRLRKQLGDELFVRTAAGMQATPRAEELIVPVREALAALRRVAAPAEAFDPSSATRRFRICMTDASHITLLPRLLAHVRAMAPGVRLEAARIDEQTGQALQSGRLQCLADQPVVALAAVRLEVGEPDLFLLRGEGKVQCRAVEARRHPEPVFMVVGRHCVVTRPRAVERGLAGIAQAEVMGRTCLQAVDPEVKPLEMRALNIRADRQTNARRVAGVENLDVAAVEIGADSEGHSAFLYA